MYDINVIDYAVATRNVLMTISLIILLLVIWIERFSNFKKLYDTIDKPTPLIFIPKWGSN